MLPIAVGGFSIVQAAATRSALPLIGLGLVIACTGLGFHASRRGKFVVWKQLLDRVELAGHERVLDLGCGRGAVLMLAAGRLTTGRAVGIDRWHRSDQSGNRPNATMRNARLEGVADRVVVCTADIAALPLSTNSFDVVVSNIALHNLKGDRNVDRAIEEAVRVLKPGGRLLLGDLQRARRYHRRLLELGIADASRRNLGWRMWWTGPWLPTHIVTGTKPFGSEPGDEERTDPDTD